MVMPLNFTVGRTYIVFLNVLFSAIDLILQEVSAQRELYLNVK